MAAVRDPAGEDIGYCLVLGRNEEFFGLEVALGQEGLEGVIKIQSGMIDPEDIENLHTKNWVLSYLS